MEEDFVENIDGGQASNNFEFLTPEWEVDYKKYYPISNSRFEWIDNAVIGGWSSFVVLPKQTINKHIVFETRWEEPVLHDNVIFELEILTSTSRKWQKVASWISAISYGTLDENINSVSSFVILEAESEKIVNQQQINLSELHRQVNDEHFAKTGISAGQLISFSSTNRLRNQKKKK